MLICDNCFASCLSFSLNPLYHADVGDFSFCVLSMVFKLVVVFLNVLKNLEL